MNLVARIFNSLRKDFDSIREPKLTDLKILGTLNKTRRDEIMASIDAERIILPILILGGLLAALTLFLVFELREIAFIIFAISAFIGVFYSSKLTKDD